VSDQQNISNPASKPKIEGGSTLSLINDISILIDEARTHVAREYNSTQALLCWLIGKRVDEEILKSERAEYGEAIVITLSRHLSLALTALFYAHINPYGTFELDLTKRLNFGLIGSGAL
jgi:hypothetical protein